MDILREISVLEHFLVFEHDTGSHLIYHCIKCIARVGVPTPVSDSNDLLSHLSASLKCVEELWEVEGCHEYTDS